MQRIAALAKLNKNYILIIIMCDSCNYIEQSVQLRLVINRTQIQVVYKGHCQRM